jgi:hypothetical protein
MDVHADSLAMPAPFPQPLPGRFWAKVDTSAGPAACWPWTGACSRKRYGHVRGHIVYKPGDGTTRYLVAPRVALWLSADPLAASLDGYLRSDAPSPLEACHCCPGGEQPLCCNPRHLYWGTRADNVSDRYHGRQAAFARDAAAIVAAVFGA